MSKLLIWTPSIEILEVTAKAFHAAYLRYFGASLNGRVTMEDINELADSTDAMLKAIAEVTDGPWEEGDWVNPPDTCGQVLWSAIPFGATTGVPVAVCTVKYGKQHSHDLPAAEAVAAGIARYLTEDDTLRVNEWAELRFISTNPDWLTIETDGGIVTECLPVTVNGTDGYAVHGDPDEGFYPDDCVRVIGGE